jgi:hypothetical protein
MGSDCLWILEALAAAQNAKRLGQAAASFREGVGSRGVEFAHIVVAGKDELGADIAKLYFRSRDIFPADRGRADRSAGAKTASREFPHPHVTSNLAHPPNLRDHGRGRDGPLQSQPPRPNSFVSPTLILKLFESRILQKISP